MSLIFLSNNIYIIYEVVARSHDKRSKSNESDNRGCLIRHLTNLRAKDTNLAGCADNLAAAKKLVAKFGEKNIAKITSHLKSYGYAVDEGLTKKLVDMSKEGQTELAIAK